MLAQGGVCHHHGLFREAAGPSGVKVARVLAHAEGADVPVESEHEDTQDQHLLIHNPNTHRHASAIDGDTQWQPTATRNRRPHCPTANAWLSHVPR